MTSAPSSSSSYYPWLREVARDLYSGVAVGSSHSRWWVRTRVLDSALRLAGLGGGGGAGAGAGGGGDGEGGVDEERRPGLEVVGVGYGRTGTYSLTLALEKLGYPCLHTQHLYESPDIFDMWAREVFTPSIMAGTALMGSPDLDLMVARGWRATTDLPMALYYEQVLERYPDCKFILTTRESSDVWFKSWDTLTRTITQPTSHFLWMAHVRNLDRYFRWLFSTVNRDDKYFAAPYPLPDQIRTNAIASYEDHNRRVREVVPPSQLLEYSVKDGWGPLCDFLHVRDCPTAPFPRTNSARSVQIQAVAAVVLPLSAVLFALFYVFACAFGRATGRTVLGWADVKRMEALAALNARERKRLSERKRAGKAVKAKVAKVA